MPFANIIAGNDGSNSLLGTDGRDVMYGFDPDGPQANITSISATRVASGFDQSLCVAAAPGDPDRLFVVEKTGHIKILNLATGQVSPNNFFDVSAQVATDGEQGLLGLTFDPKFVSNGYFYINMINRAGDTEIRRYQVTNNSNQVDPQTSTLIISVDQPAGRTNHKAGWIGFGPDGDLYVPLGDGGGGDDPDGNAQNINSLLGKILRLDVTKDGFPGDPSRNYGIPTDNMFVGTAGADEIYAMGVRNPWRDSFDRGTGQFFIGDVGQDRFEEIDIGALGANYGWDIFEGPAPNDPGSITAGTLTPPIHSYGRSDGGTVIGGYVYRGPSEGLQGQYFFTDFLSARVFTLAFDGSSWVRTERTSQISTDVGAINTPVSFGEDAIGNLYVVDLDGEIFRLTPNLVSNDQADTLRGFSGDDLMFGGSGKDQLDGGSGQDELQGGNGNDRVDGGLGFVDFTGHGLFADVTGDGKVDLIQVTTSRADVAASSADAKFNPFANWTNGTTNSDIAADFNGDGKADLLQLYMGRALVSLSDGTNFVPWADWAKGTTSLDRAVDLNHDGKADLLQVYQGRAIVALSNGSSFGAWTDWTTGLTPNDRTADLNGDMRPDLLQIFQGRVLVALSNGSSFGAWTDWTTGATPSDQFVDVNADGRADLVQLFQARAIVALSTGSNFGAWTNWTAGTTANDALVDLNGDGRPDLLQLFNGRALVALSNGSSFGAWTDWTTGTTASDKAIDVNGDGKSDLVQSFNGSAYVALSTGDSFTPWSIWEQIADSGNDLLIGGPGNDTFAFSSIFGRDTVADFQPGDKIELNRSLFDNFSVVQSHISQDGLDTIITYDANNSIRLANMSMGNLHASDFIFV